MECVIDTTDVEVDLGGVNSIVFEHAFDEPGTYSVGIDELGDELNDLKIMPNEEQPEDLTEEELEEPPIDDQPGLALVKR